MNDKSGLDQSVYDAKLSVILAEYNSLHSEITSIQRSIQELALVSLASIAGLATIIIALLENSPNLLLVLLLLLPFPFSAMLMSFLGQINALTNIGLYIADHLEPAVHQLLGEEQSSVFKWQSLQFHGRRYRGIQGFMATGYWAVGQGLLIGFPIVGALISAIYLIQKNIGGITIWHMLALGLGSFIAIILIISVFVTFYRFGYFRSRQAL